MGASSSSKGGVVKKQVEKINKQVKLQMIYKALKI